MIIVLVTFSALVYVYQQSEIVNLAYKGQKRVQQLEDLLDKNRILRYNIARSASVVQIGERISEADFQIPDSVRFLRMATTAGGQGESLTTKESFLSRIFSVKRQAEAQVINP